MYTDAPHECRAAAIGQAHSAPNERYEYALSFNFINGRARRRRLRLTRAPHFPPPRDKWLPAVAESRNNLSHFSGPSDSKP